MKRKQSLTQPPFIDHFLEGKSAHTLLLYHHFVDRFRQIGPVEVLPAKTMIGIAIPRRRIAWITALGKNFVHVVFPFSQPYEDNLCFTKIAPVPGTRQVNHHFRMYAVEDVNKEVEYFMRLAYSGEAG